MKTSDIFGNIFHLQRRRRNAGRPYRRHRTILKNWYKEFTKNAVDYGTILETILKERNTHEA